ncbi:MAG: hypothetical protein F6K16_42610 [Symploca sp. SIO2B6]|nr:hypothetical protein [Symploca sp. SIO2B6]
MEAITVCGVLRAIAVWWIERRRSRGIVEGVAGSDRNAIAVLVSRE